MATFFKRIEGNFKDPRVCLLWSKRLSRLFRPLSLNIAREICLYLTPNCLLADLRQNSLRFLDSRSQTRTPQVVLTCTIPLSTDTSRWIILHTGKVLCCGGKSRKDWLSTVYLISGNGEVERKPALLKGRASPGLIQWQDYVLLFGGENRGPLLDSESLALPNGRCWQSLPSMSSPKHSFNPCLFYDVIYLCGCGSEWLEGFAPRANCYTALSVHLPKLENCCLYVNRDVLVIVSPALVVKYRPGCEGVIEEGRAAGADFSKAQNSQPVVDETSRRVFGLHGGKCWSFNMDVGV